MYAHCTKYNTGRKGDLPGPVASRSADVNKVVKRNDVEKGTNSKVFWGNMKAEVGKQTQPKVWVTSHKVDYPRREGGQGMGSELLKQRGAFMRTENIKLGTGGEPMSAVKMQKLPREYYVGRVQYRRGGTHTKTKSELYVCPAEVQEWKENRLETLSHRQFTGATPNAVQGGGHRDRIRQDMLSSHFTVGNEAQAGGPWVSRARSDFQKVSSSELSAARQAVPEGVHSTISCLNLMDPTKNGPPGQCTTPKPTQPKQSYPERLKSEVGVARPLTAGHGAAGPAPPLDEAAKADRMTRHTKHSWKLGYDDDAGDRTRYYTEQRTAFTPVRYRRQ